MAKKNNEDLDLTPPDEIDEFTKNLTKHQNMIEVSLYAALGGYLAHELKKQGHNTKYSIFSGFGLVALMRLTKGSAGIVSPQIPILTIILTILGLEKLSRLNDYFDTITDIADWPKDVVDKILKDNTQPEDGSDDVADYIFDILWPFQTRR